MGVRVSIEHADNNQDLVSVNHGRLRGGINPVARMSVVGSSTSVVDGSLLKMWTIRTGLRPVSGRLPVREGHIRIALQRVEVVFGKSIPSFWGDEQESPFF